MKVRFQGVRGSTPTPTPEYSRYGGNTSNVLVEPFEGADPIVCDMGTGARTLGAEGPIRATVLLSHLHFDHIQGLPFCAALLQPGSEIDLYGPGGHGESLEEAVRGFLRPPLFPVTIDDLPATVRFHDLLDGVIELEGARVLAAPVPHTGPTCGFRIEAGGVSMAYLPDHQQPPDGSFGVDERVLAVGHQVDLLVHDAQYLPHEFERKSTWGHSTVEYAVNVALRCGARRLALFHHDPLHDDETMDSIAERAQVCGSSRGRGLEVLVAREGMVLELS